MKIKPWRNRARYWKTGWEAGTMAGSTNNCWFRPQDLFWGWGASIVSVNAAETCCRWRKWQYCRIAINVPGLVVTCEQRWCLPPSSVHGLWSAVVPWTGWTGVLPSIPSQSSIFLCRWSSRLFHSQEKLWDTSSQDITRSLFGQVAPKAWPSP